MHSKTNLYLQNLIQMNLLTRLALIGLLLVNLPLFAQDGFVISGTVKGPDNIPIPGANIIVLNTTRGTATDFDGLYELRVSSGEVVQFSYVGYLAQTIAITNQTQLDIILQEDLEQLEEVVVIGYGRQKKSHVTGAISKVVNEDLETIPVARVDDALIGQVSGVNIQSTDGAAGSAPTITIRGVGSLAGDSTPLIVVDGTIVDSEFLSVLNMADVESFEVLKDAASSAIFGSKGANGIIMVTTKSGKEGKTRLNYSTFTGSKWARHSDAYTFSIAETAQAQLDATGSLSDRTRYKQLIGIDRSWQDDIFDGGNITSHSLTARGGSAKTKFSAGLNYLHDEGILLTDEFSRYGARFKLDHEINDRFSFGINISPTYTKRRRFDGSTHDILRQTNWLPIYHDANTIQYVDRNIYPDVQIGDYAIQRHFDNYDLDGDGDLIDISNTSNTNPAAKVLERERRDFQMKFFGSAYLNYKITDGLDFRTMLSITNQNTRRTRWQGVLSNRNGASAASMNEISQNSLYMISDNLLSYSKDFNGHEVSAILGITGERTESFYSSITGTGYTNDEVKQITNAAVISGADGFEWEKRNLGMYFRANYAYQDKYLASFSIRRDGSSIFGEGFKYGYFPAGSVGWNIAREDFLKNSEVVSNLKIRASYGVTGNDFLNVGAFDINAVNNVGTTSLSTGNILIDYYPSLALLNSVTADIDGSITPGFNPVNIANAGLKWERLIEFNPGIDFGFFRNRIAGSVDFYQRTSDQLLINNPISETTGFREALVNIGEVKNEGFEIELRTKNIIKEKFRWSSTILVTFNQNTLVDFADSDGQITNVDDKRAAEWINLEGNPISTYYGWVVDREIPLEFLNDAYHPVGGQAQDVYVKDLNGDGLIDDEDKAKLGDPYPDMIWSFGNNFTVGQVDFSFLFQGSHGAEIRNMGDQYLFNQFNSSQDFDPAITPDQGFIKQKIFTNSIIQDASYISLRNVNVGFTFPNDFVSRIGMDNARIYVAGQNLLYKTADGYTGWNPESVDRTSPINYGYQRGGNPIARTISLGLNIDF